MVAFFNTSSINCWNVAATCEHNGHWTDATPGQLWRPSFHNLPVLTPLASSHDKSLKCWTKRPQPEHQACHQPEAMNGKDQGLQPSSLNHPPGVAPIYPFFLCLSGEVLCARCLIGKWSPVKIKWLIRSGIDVAPHAELNIAWCVASKALRLCCWSPDNGEPDASGRTASTCQKPNNSEGTRTSLTLTWWQTPRYNPECSCSSIQFQFIYLSIDQSINQLL